MAQNHYGGDSLRYWADRIKDCPHTVVCGALDLRGDALDSMLAWINDSARPGLYLIESNNLNRSRHDRTVTYVHFSDPHTAFEFKMLYG
ncbi:MAG: hypothetical protein EOO77_21320 [Oxalobacteraceae bacterium]|nr:MAG: hypothetical protein EOO77_21320 [Oxalobacteraceae bacterium]